MIRKGIITLGAAGLLVSSAAIGPTTWAQDECSTTIGSGESIQETINEVSAESVICLEAGTFYESLEIRKSIVLRGQGPESTAIDGSGVEGEAFKGNGVRIVGRAQVSLEGITFRNASGLTVVESAESSLHNVGVEANSSTGITLQNSARLKLRDSEILGNEFGGLSAEGLSNATIQNTRFSGNDNAINSAEVDVCCRAQVTVEDTSISGGGGVGARAYGESQLTLTETQISGNGNFGVYLYQSAQATIQESTIEKNADGIVLEDATEAIIMGNRILDNEGYGIQADSEDNIQQCEGNSLRGNGDGSFNEAATAKCE